MKNYFKYFILISTILLLSGCKLFSKNEDVKPINSIVFETNSEVKLEKMNYCEECDDTVVELPVPQQEGYIFEGWFADKELTQKVDVTSNKLTDAVWKDNTTTLYAKWISENECSIKDGVDSKTIKFNTTGGNKIEDLTICTSCPNKTMPLLFPIKNGYLFDGWYIDAGYTQKAEFSNTDITNATWVKVGCYSYQTTIYAKWVKENSCNDADGIGTETIRFDTVGGNEIEDVTRCITCPNKTWPLLMPYKVGYTFEGWYIDAGYTQKVEFSGNDITNANWTKVGCNNRQTILYAKWKQENNCNDKDGVNTKTIKFDTLGGNKINDLTVCVSCPNNDIMLPLAFRMGYKFEGWYTDKAYTKKVEVKGKDLTNVKWKQNGCYNKTTTIYAKWSKESTCDTRDGADTKTIKFDTLGGNKINDFVVCVTCPNREIMLPLAFRTGYKFEGWYIDKEYTKKVILENNNLTNAEWKQDGCYNKTTTIYAKWSKESACDTRDGADTKTVIFDTVGGEALDNLKFCTTCPRRQIVLPTPTKAGYTFAGWYTDKTYTTKVEGDYNNITNATWTQDGCYNKTTIVYAKWEK